MYVPQEPANPPPELSSPAHRFNEVYPTDTYEDSNASFDETKFSVPEFDSSPFRSSVTQYSDAFSHKGQDLEELGTIPSTLFDSPTSKDVAYRAPEGRPVLRRTQSDRVSGTSLDALSPRVWQKASSGQPSLFYGTRRIPGRFAFEKDAFWREPMLAEHISHASPSEQDTSSDTFVSSETKLFDDMFSEPLGSYSSKSKAMQHLSLLGDTEGESWGSMPSRYLHVTNLPKTIETWILKEIFEKFGDIQGILSKNLHKDGSVVVSFYDVRDCIKIQKQLRHYRFFNDRYLDAQFCSKRLLLSMFKGGTILPFLCKNEGEIFVSFEGSGDLSKNVLFNLLSSYGDIRVIKSPPTIEKAIICEYFDIRDAMSAVDELNGRVVQDNMLHVTFYESGYISWKMMSNEWQHLHDENVILDQFKSLDISEKKLDNTTNEYLAKHHDLASTAPRSKLSSLDFLSNKIPNESKMDRSHTMTSYSLQDEKSSYTLQTPNGSNEMGYYKRNMQKLNNVHINGNNCGYLNDRYANLHNNYGHSSTIKETFDDELKGKAFNPSLVVGGSSNLRRIYSANMKRSITHDGVWAKHSTPMTDHLSLNLKYPSFDVLKTSISNSGTNLIAEKNKVDYDRITRGLDMRTTIMIKNIPNKFTQQMLQEYIDATNSKTYDFLYLRIDFRNRCNVGYAFVNFIDPISIVTFGQARVGTKWNRFHSDKICDISYANIQGKECLIEKFRNSCVMDEDPSYRPRIFISHGPATGEEQEFPAPNNPRRKLRSIVSAQQIGLFPPAGSRAPWTTRDEHAFL